MAISPAFRRLQGGAPSGEAGLKAVLLGASRSEFAAGLSDRVDVGAFAAYVALQDIVDNFDDMSGPGQNYYSGTTSKAAGSAR
jgi:spore coat protein CotH